VTGAALALKRLPRRWRRARLLVLTMIASSVGFVAFSFSLWSQSPSDIADAGLGPYAVASALDFTSIRNVSVDRATHSVLIGGPTALGMLRIPLHVRSGASWNRLFVTGAAPLMYGSDASAHVFIDGRIVGDIRAIGVGPGGGPPYQPIPPPGPLIRIPSDPEAGYHFAISSTTCVRGCSIAIVTKGTQWRIDRVGVGLFRPSTAPFEMVDRAAR
jgi:hypothetical protein